MVEKIGPVDDGTHAMFRLLVETALAYRDRLREEKGDGLTVGETQAALDGFMDVLQTHRVPDALTGHTRELVVLWLEEIKRTIHH